MRIRYALIAIIVLLLAVYGLRGLREGVHHLPRGVVVEVGNLSHGVLVGNMVGFQGGRTGTSYAAQSATR